MSDIEGLLLLPFTSVLRLAGCDFWFQTAEFNFLSYTFVFLLQRFEMYAFGALVFCTMCSRALIFFSPVVTNSPESAIVVN